MRMTVQVVIAICVVATVVGSLLTARSALRLSWEMSQTLRETAVDVAATDSLIDQIQISAYAGGVILTLRAVTDSFRVMPKPAVCQQEATADRWGNPIVIRWQTGQSPDGGMVLDVRSAGPDGKIFTADDIAFSNAFDIGRRVP